MPAEKREWIKEGVSDISLMVGDSARYGIKPNANESLKINGPLRERVKFQKSRNNHKSAIAEMSTHLLHFVKPHRALDGNTSEKVGYSN